MREKSGHAHVSSVQAITQRKSLHVAILGALATAGTLVATPGAEARITSIVIDCARSQSPTFCPAQSPTFGAMSFGSVGQYEKLRGTAFGELDQTDPRNAVITDIEFVPATNRNPATPTGKVKYSMDVFILKPINLGNGNHRVLLDMNNRGEMRLARLNEFSLDNPPLTNDPSTAADAGTGFVMKQGYTVVGNGWDVGATTGGTTGGGMTISVPPAKNPNGTSITGPSYEYIVFDNATTSTATLTYPAATLDKSQATLTVRTHVNDAPVPISSSQWEYTSAAGTAIRLLPTGTRFAQSAIYDFSYTAKDPVVAAVGLAATRDFVSFLRHGTAAQGNPLAGDVVHTFSYSISQPSRTLNDFVYFGFNEDEDGSRVLDGIAGEPRTSSSSAPCLPFEWGYTRIQGALANLNHKVGRGTIASVLMRNGSEPAPERGRRTPWSTSLKARWKVLAASDFLTVEVWTAKASSRTANLSNKRRLRYPTLQC